MPERRVIVKEPRGISRFIERIEGDSLSRLKDILGEPIMMGFIPQRDLRRDPVDDDETCSKEKDAPDYFDVFSILCHPYFVAKMKRRSKTLDPARMGSRIGLTVDHLPNFPLRVVVGGKP